MDAQRILFLFQASDALVALIGYDGHIAVLVSVDIVLPRTYLFYGYSALLVGITVFDAAGDFTRMASGAEIIVDQNTFSRHATPRPSPYVSRFCRVGAQRARMPSTGQGRLIPGRPLPCRIRLCNETVVSGSAGKYVFVVAIVSYRWYDRRYP